MEKDKSGGKKVKEIEPVRPLFSPTRFDREMERMFRSIGRIPRFRFGWPEELRQRWGMTGADFPVVEIYDEKADIVVKAELPGMQKEELEINLVDDVLTIKGEKKKEEEVKEKDYYFSERSYGSFERSIDIPKKVLSDRVKASFKDGVLEVRLQKSEPETRKEIKIKVE
ncbi:MAG TPA: Hsp20/alpha crystallin family protein [Nitrospiria bacterium]|nr:Hsp20/alpha crystallin family protein [Nitrospiria bacterium]